jgi:small-conductance mechanosensitive channel/CRP-like cAMP-binding protein
MPPEISLLENILYAVALGLGTAVILWLLRNLTLVRRTRTAVVLAVGGWALFWLALGLEGSRAVVLVQLLLAAAILLTVNLGLQVFEVVVWEQVFRSRQRRVVPRLLLEIFNLAVMIAASLAILNQVFDADLSGLLITSTVVSAVIGLALQDMLGNLVSGLALQLDRPFDVGDWIQVGLDEGAVTEMKWRTVTLRSIDNLAIIIPNANMVREQVRNFSRPTAAQRLHVRVGLPYSVPPGRIRDVLQPAVQGAGGVLAAPAPDILVAEYGDSAIVYDVRYWIDDYSRTPEIRSEVLARIWYALSRAGISVPFPVRDVTLRTVTADTEREVHDRQQTEIFRSLRPLPIFAPLSDDQIGRLADHTSVYRFHAGEELFRQGDEGDSLFVVVSGRARVEFQNVRGDRQVLAIRQAGDFFGEMSLLTGARRSASVTAETDMVVEVVDKAAFAPVLSGDLSSLQMLSEIVEGRVADLRQMEAASPEPAQAGGADSLLGRIARFLGLG